MLHKFLIEEISCHIEHHAAPWVIWSIADGDLRHAPLGMRLQFATVNGWWQQLQEGLDAVEQTAIVVSSDYHPLAIDRKTVSFGGSHLICVNLKHHVGTVFLV